MTMLRTYWFALLATLAIWGSVAGFMGYAALTTVVILTVLEVTFSFDNAVVNSKLVGFLSPWWQKLFMTAGILIAVFVVRFALPILIVSLTTHTSFSGVVQLAVHHPDVYGQKLTAAGPMIDAFGGTFLLMIAASFFLDFVKDEHWIAPIERRLSGLGKYDNLGIFILVILAAILGFTVKSEVRLSVVLAAMFGLALHIGLDIFGAVVDGDEDEEEVKPKGSPAKQLVGMAAAVMFTRLEVLDASFSFDGVIGAFAITGSIILIMGGLGAGALWVRSMTVQLVRSGTLAKYRYLEHGAHWAILFLGGVMMFKLYDIEPPEWVTGGLGLFFIVLAVISSVRAERRDKAQISAVHFA